NHALVLGGKPGIGKDTILEPVRQAVGPWNFADISPKQALGEYSDFFKSVILCIHEARDLGEYDRFAFYEHMKPIIAAPPPVLRVNEKYLRQYYVPNLAPIIRGSWRLAMRAHDISRVDGGGCSGTLATRLEVGAGGESGTCRIAHGPQAAIEVASAVKALTFG